VIFIWEFWVGGLRNILLENHLPESRNELQRETWENLRNAATCWGLKGANRQHETSFQSCCNVVTCSICIFLFSYFTWGHMSFYALLSERLLGVSFELIVQKNGWQEFSF
jgi:hypothetical protein